MYALCWAFIGIALGPTILASGVRPRQLVDPITDGRPDCTTYSLSYPLFRIYDPIWKSPNGTDGKGGTHGDFWFVTHNMATDVQVECEVKSADLFLKKIGDGFSPWNDCKDNATKFRVSLETNEFQLRQSWVCDNSPDIQFVGYKNTNLPVRLGCIDDVDETGPFIMCFLANLNIEPRLSSPLDIAPTMPWLPSDTNFGASTCATKSEYPEWSIEGLSYDHTAPQAGSSSAIPEYGLSFNLTNLSNDERLACFIRVDETTLARTNSERWLDCLAPGVSGPEAFVSTTALFNKDHNLLAINQTWRCDTGFLSGNQNDYNGVGYLTLPLDCTSSGNQQSPQVDLASSSYTCTMPTTKLNGYYLGDYIPPLPHTSYTHSCTINSLKLTSLTLKDYTIEPTVDAGKLSKVANFSILNPGPGDKYNIRRMPVEDDGLWHLCVDGLEPLPWQLVSCQYRLGAGEDIGFQLQWYCDDRDPEHAILFGTTASGRLGGSEGSTNIKLDVTAKSWKATSSPMDRGVPLPWV